MDFRARNAATRVLEGDIRSLTRALRMSAEGLVAAFYLFALPPRWSKPMWLGEKIPWATLGVNRPGDLCLGPKCSLWAGLPRLESCNTPTGVWR